MIFGNPHKFAILLDCVPEWSLENGYKNGIFHFVIDGALFPSETSVATLGGDLYCMLEGNALLNPREDHELFAMNRLEAFAKMLNAMLPSVLNSDFDVPDDFESDYGYQASTYNLEDNSCYVFAVGCGDKIRVLGAKVGFLSGNDADGYKWTRYQHIDVHETILLKKDVVTIVNKVKSYYEGGAER